MLHCNGRKKVRDQAGVPQIVSLTTVAGEYGWPTSTVLPHVPETDEEKALLIDTLQDWKTDKYQEIVCAFPASSMQLSNLKTACLCHSSSLRARSTESSCSNVCHSTATFFGGRGVWGHKLRLRQQESCRDCGGDTNR